MSHHSDDKYVVKSIVSTKAAVIGPSGKLLLLRRSPSHPYHAGEWDLIGGLWDTKDSLIAGLQREAQEEAKIVLKQILLFDARTFVRSSSDDHYISLLYTAKTPMENVNISYEHDAFRWVTKHELDNYPLRPHWRLTAEAAFTRYDG